MTTYLKSGVDRVGRRLLALCMALLLMFQTVGFSSAYAAGNALTVETVDCIQGQEATVRVTVPSGLGAAMLQFALEYDSSALTLISATAGDCFTGLDEPTVNSSVPGKVYVSWDTTGTALTAAGSLLELKFSLASDAPEGLSAIQVDGSETYIFKDADFADLGLTTVSGGVNVKPRVAVTGVTLNKSTLTLGLGSTETLVATVAPTSASDKSIVWASTDRNIAYVEGDGKVVGFNRGNCIITATAKENSKLLAQCRVFVEDGYGACGDKVTWTLDSQGVFTVSGTGPMRDVNSELSPIWARYCDEVTEVIIESGVTSVGDYCFRTFRSLRSVTIPASVRTIGTGAFYNCPALDRIHFAHKVTGNPLTIATGAFAILGEGPIDTTVWTPGIGSAMNAAVRNYDWDSSGRMATNLVEGTYRVAFNPNGGSCSTWWSATNSSGKLTSLPTATREGYTLDCWVKSDTSETVTPNVTVFTDNSQIMAIWNKDTINVHVNTEEELRAALANSYTDGVPDETRIYIDSDISLSSELTVMSHIILEVNAKLALNGWRALMGGTVNVNAAGTLSLDGGSLDAMGMLSVKGGKLNINGGTLKIFEALSANSGTITVSDGGVFDNWDGDLALTGSAKMYVRTGARILNSAQLRVERGATLTLDQGSTLQNSYQMTVNGTLNANGALNLEFQTGLFTLGAGGVMKLGGAMSACAFTAIEGNMELLSGGVLQVWGESLEIRRGGVITGSAGSMLQTGETSLTVKTGGTLNLKADSVGEFHGSVIIDGGTFNNAGSVTNSERLTVLGGKFAQTATGTLTNNGNVDISSDGRLECASGSSLVNEGGITVGSNYEGYHKGYLTANGSYSGAGSIDVIAPGSDVTGSANPAIRSYAVSTLSELKAALTKNCGEIILTQETVLTGSLTLPEGKTLNLNGNLLSLRSGYTFTVNGIVLTGDGGTLNTLEKSSLVNNGLIQVGYPLQYTEHEYCAGNLTVNGAYSGAGTIAVFGYDSVISGVSGAQGRVYGSFCAPSYNEVAGIFDDFDYFTSMDIYTAADFDMGSGEPRIPANVVLHETGGSTLIHNGTTMKLFGRAILTEGATTTVEDGSCLDNRGVLVLGDANSAGHLVLNGEEPLTGTGGIIIANPGSTVTMPEGMHAQISQSFTVTDAEQLRAAMEYAANNPEIGDISVSITAGIELTTDLRIPENVRVQLFIQGSAGLTVTGAALTVDGDVTAFNQLVISADAWLINNGLIDLQRGGSLVMDGTYAGANGTVRSESDNAITGANASAVAADVVYTKISTEAQLSSTIEACVAGKKVGAVTIVEDMTITGDLTLPGNNGNNWMELHIAPGKTLLLENGARLELYAPLHINDRASLITMPGSTLVNNARICCNNSVSTGEIERLGCALTVNGDYSGNGDIFALGLNNEISGVDRTKITVNATVKSYAELKTGLELAEQGCSAVDLFLAQDVVVNENLSISQNVYLSISAKLTVGSRYTVENNGVVDVMDHYTASMGSSGKRIGTLEISKGGCFVNNSGVFVGAGHVLNVFGTWSGKPADIQDGAVINAPDGGYRIQGKLVESATVSCAAGSTISLGVPVQLTAELLPNDAWNQDIEWSLEVGGDIAEIDSSGVLTASGEGPVTVRAAAMDGSGVFGTYELEARAYRAEIRFNGTAAGDEISLKGLEKLSLTAALLPAALGSGTTVQWSLKNPADIAYVAASFSGASATITAKNLTAPREVILVAGSKDGKAAADELKVIIVPKALNVQILRDDDEYVTGKSLTLDIGDYPDGISFKAETRPTEADNRVTWSCTQNKLPKPTLLTVDDETGTVTFKPTDVGSYVITATAADGSKKAASVTINAVKPIGELRPSGDWPTVLVGGSSFVLKVTDAAGKAPAANAVLWSLNSEDDAYASIKPTTGALTTKPVLERVTVTITCTVADKPGVRLTHSLELVPAATGVQIYYGDELVTGKTVPINTQLNEEYILSAAVMPEAALQGVKWVSSNPAIATVTANEDGTAKVTPLKAGLVTVTCTSTSGSKTAKVTLDIGVLTKTVTIIQPADFVGTLRGEGTLKLSAQLESALPGVAPTKTGVTWSVSDSSVATVDRSGTVKAKPVFDDMPLTITARSADGGAEDSIDIIVCPKKDDTLLISLDDVNVTKQTVTLERAEGESHTISARLYSDEPVGDLTWKSSTKTVADIDTDTGELLLLKDGKSTITVTDSEKRSATFNLVVAVQTNGISIEGKKGDVEYVASGKSVEFIASVTPDNATSKKVTWSVDDESAATMVAASGKLTAKAVNEETIVNVTATAADGSGITSDPYSIIIRPLTTGVSVWEGGKNMSGLSDTVYITGDPEADVLSLSANTFPETATQDVVWSSNNTRVATVDEFGQVNILSAGKATIKATAADGSGKNVSVTYTFVKLVESVEFPESVYFLASGKSLQLAPTVLAADATNKKLSWSFAAGDEAFATLSKSGMLKAQTVTGPAQVTVTATADDGSEVSDSCTVNIYPIATGIAVFNDAGAELNARMEEKMVLQLNPSETYTTAVYPDDACQDVLWVSSNPAVVSFEDENLVAHKPGSATITVKAADGSGKSTGFKVSVTKLVDSIELPLATELTAGRQITFKPIIHDSDASNKALTWRLNNDLDGLLSLSGATLRAKNTDTVRTAIVTAKAADAGGKTASCFVTVYPATTSVKLLNNENEDVTGSTIAMVLPEEGSLNLTAVSEPAAARQAFTWKSSNSAVASVDADGSVTGVKPGTVTIVATAADGTGKSAYIRLRITKLVESVTLPESLVLAGGRQLRLKAAVEASNASNRSLTWSLAEGDSAYASISSTGVLRAKTMPAGTGPCTVTVTAAANDGSGKWDSCMVDIWPAATKVSICNNADINVTGKTLTLKAGDSIRLHGFAEPEGEVYANCAWKLSSTRLAEIEPEGEYVTVTGLQAGTLTLTATAQDGTGKTASVRIKVYSTKPYVSVQKLNLEGCTVSFKNAANPNYSASSYKVGNTALMVVAPKSGYTLDMSDISVKGLTDGIAVELTEDARLPNAYSFIMPDGGVTVEVDAQRG